MKNLSVQDMKTQKVVLQCIELSVSVSLPMYAFMSVNSVLYQGYEERVFEAE